MSHGAAGEPKPNGSRDGPTPTTTPTIKGASTPPLGSGTAQAARRFDGTPAASVYFDRGGRKTGRDPPVGRGTDGISVTLSQCKRAWRLAIPRPPDPRQTATCESRRNRLDDPPQPSAEPNGTLLLGSEPVVFLTGGVAGNACVSGRARAGSLAQPLGPSGLGRRSPHDCWVRFAFAVSAV